MFEIWDSLSPQVFARPQMCRMANQCGSALSDPRGWVPSSMNIHWTLSTHWTFIEITFHFRFQGPHGLDPDKEERCLGDWCDQVSSISFPCSTFNADNLINIWIVDCICKHIKSHILWLYWFVFISCGSWAGRAIDQSRWCTRARNGARMKTDCHRVVCRHTRWRYLWVIQSFAVQPEIFLNEINSPLCLQASVPHITETCLKLNLFVGFNSVVRGKVAARTRLWEDLVLVTKHGILWQSLFQRSITKSVSSIAFASHNQTYNPSSNLLKRPF